MLGFAVVAMAFGLAYVGPISVPDAPSPLQILESLMPLQIWGILWFLCSGMLWISAFQKEQAFPLAFFALLMTLWIIIYMVSFTQEFLATGQSYQWINPIVFLGIIIASRGASRMVNPVRNKGAHHVPPFRGDHVAE